MALLRLARGRYFRPGVPVVCVGNINVGGTGKTPFVICLAERFLKAGWKPHIVCRGYRGRAKETIKVDGFRHNADLVGDEALLLSAFAPTWVTRNRALAAQLAVQDGAEILLLDDGFQDPSLGFDLAFIMVDATIGFGNFRVLPAGPLREPVKRGLARAQFLIAVGTPEERRRFLDKHRLQERIGVAEGALVPLNTGLELGDAPVLAFAGIGRPEKFRQTLRQMGFNVARFVALGDHQPLTERLMARFDAEARAKSLHLVTTEKDAARLPANWRGSVLTVPVRMQLADWTAVDREFARLGMSVD